MLLIITLSQENDVHTPSPLLLVKTKHETTNILEV